VFGVWVERSPLRSLPRRALPRRADGLAAFLDAERLFAEAEWDNAHAAYENAVRTDSTCWICLWRQTEVERWLGREPDPERVRRYRVHADSLPPPWASLMRAAQLRVAARLDTLHTITERWRGDFLGWFQLGDELFHRGPLVGHRRVEAVPALERAARLQPDFAPAWEHLAWAATAAGDSASAANALVSLETHSVASDAYSLALRALLHVGFAWRFYPDTLAQRLTVIALSAPASQGSSNLGAGPRLLPTFDAPRGAIALGEMLAQQPIRDLQRSGLIAQIFGAVALGRIDSTRGLARRVADVAPEPALNFFFAELQAMLAVLDSAAVSADDARDGLRLWLLSSDSTLRQRAAWISSVLEQRSRLRGSPPRELSLTVTAELLAAGGHAAAALRLVNHINVDSVARVEDPFVRALVHFRRAEWRAGNGDIEGAQAELIWHEHSDVVGLPTEDPQAAEVDWAFGTLARWRLARLLDRARGVDRGAACDAYAGVIRNWTGAPAPYGARADTARARARELGCARH
jgi:tetratricopeptide (TPR) repeat protein